MGHVERAMRAAGHAQARERHIEALAGQLSAVRAYARTVTETLSVGQEAREVALRVLELSR